MVTLASITPAAMPLAMLPKKPVTSAVARHILVAYDFSPESDEALRYAHRYATARGVGLTVCHVVAPSTPTLGSLFPLISPLLIAGETHPQAGAVLRATGELTQRTIDLTGRPKPDFQVTVTTGYPYAAIIECARSSDAELIVVGAGRAPGIARTILGSVAERVVRYADRPVLIARPDYGLRVMIATDLSQQSTPALHAGVAEARRRNVPALLVYCLPRDVADLAMDEQQLIEAQAYRQLEAVRLANNINAECRVLIGDPADLLVRSALGECVNLVVVGARGITGLARVLLGSVSEHIVRHAVCSVLVVRQSPMS